MTVKSTSILDILGISSATVCMAHCFLVPIISLLPITFLHNPWIDIVFASIGLTVVTKIILGNSIIFIKCILAISIIIVITGVLLEYFIGLDYYLPVIGGVGMIIGHIINVKYGTK